MKKLIIILSLMTFITPALADERTEIHALIKELDYLIEVSTQMKARYGRNQQRVRFNYDALINQLKATRGRSAEYLNAKGETIHRAPPRTLDQDMIRIQ